MDWMSTPLGALIDTVQGEPILEFVVHGEAASKANSRRSVTAGRGGRRMFIKSEKAEGFADAFRRQCPRRWPLISGTLAAHIHLRYASRRPDADESLVLDLMQKICIENDRQVRQRCVTWDIDPAAPLVMVRLFAWPTEPAKSSSRPAPS
jgi:hypothetical protein